MSKAKKEKPMLVWVKRKGILPGNLYLNYRSVETPLKEKFKFYIFELSYISCVQILDFKPEIVIFEHHNPMEDLLEMVEALTIGLPNIIPIFLTLEPRNKTLQTEYRKMNLSQRFILTKRLTKESFVKLVWELYQKHKK